jgi:aquaporin NIP
VIELPLLLQFSPASPSILKEISVALYRPVSGASMNPARSLGPAIISSNYRGIWVYIVGPTVGAVAGALVYNLIRLPEQEPCKLQIKPSKSFRK